MIILTIPVFDEMVVGDWLACGDVVFALAGYRPSSFEEGLHPISKSSNAVNIDVRKRSFTSF
jgi:hypothetical protein